MANLENSPASLRMEIAVVYSPAPRQIREWTLQLAPGATVAEALNACSGLAEIAELQGGELQTGIWGKKTCLDHLLKDKDRIEVYRALLVDPKIARRKRFNRQGVKSAGLFAKIRPGAKAGY